jgi:hypothetical protein
MKLARKNRAVQKLIPKEKPTGHMPSPSSITLSHYGRTAAALLGGFLLGWLFNLGLKPEKKPKTTILPVAAKQEVTPIQYSLGTLVDLPEDNLAQVDFALMNLLCAEGLPGHGKTNAKEYLRRLDQMTQEVRAETARNYYRFISNPAEFDNSEPFYKVAMISTVLEQDFGLKYNPKKIAAASVESLQDQSFFEHADDIFISGLLGEHRMGTCASMPVLLVAVGRKLGYPLKLVAAKGHLFVRWEYGDLKQNFECTNGIACYPDAHYQNWPFPISDLEVQQGYYLRSLSPKEELAVFLSLRGQVLRLHGRFVEALLAYAQANIMHPNHPDHSMGLAIASQSQAVSTGTMQPAMNQRNNDPLTELREIEMFNARNQPQFYQHPSPTTKPSTFGAFPR